MYVKVRVRAGAKREAVKETPKDHLDISVTEPAERNLANRHVVALVAAYWRVPAGKVRIISGHRSPSKILSVDI
jgi:uncharacterized protein YggU (UPF0235/DUF167 family)